MPVVVHDLTPDLWTKFEDLFGTRGAVGGCWCMYWRIGSEYRKRAASANKAAFRRVVKKGPPGLLALDGDIAVGWCQLTPREALPWLEKTKKLRRVDAMPVWAITCFYIRKGYRRQGVTTALIAAALKKAKQAGVPAVEAYPLDGELSPSSTSTGYASTFRRMGFVEVARHFGPRPIMRYVFDEALTAQEFRKLIKTGDGSGTES